MTTNNFTATENPIKALVDFKALTKRLRRAGYKVRVEFSEGTTRCAYVYKNGIRARYNEPGYVYGHPYTDGRIAFDAADLFDRISRCPYSMPIPENDNQFQQLLKLFEYVARGEGHALSDSFDLIADEKAEWD